jgi:hypothetical protein
MLIKSCAKTKKNVKSKPVFIGNNTDKPDSFIIQANELGHITQTELNQIDG